MLKPFKSTCSVFSIQFYLYRAKLLYNYLKTFYRIYALSNLYFGAKSPKCNNQQQKLWPNYIRCVTRWQQPWKFNVIKWVRAPSAESNRSHHVSPGILLPGNSPVTFTFLCYWENCSKTGKQQPYILLLLRCFSWSDVCRLLILIRTNSAAILSQKNLYLCS